MSSIFPCKIKMFFAKKNRHLLFIKSRCLLERGGYKFFPDDCHIRCPHRILSLLPSLKKLYASVKKIYLSPHGQQRIPLHGILLLRHFQSLNLYKETILVILRFDLEVGLWMVAYRTNFRSFLSDADMSAVCTLPDDIVIFRENNFLLYIIKKF